MVTQFYKNLLARIKEKTIITHHKCIILNYFVTNRVFWSKLLVNKLHLICLRMLFICL